MKKDKFQEYSKRHIHILEENVTSKNEK